MLQHLRATNFIDFMAEHLNHDILKVLNNKL